MPSNSRNAKGAGPFAEFSIAQPVEGQAYGMAGPDLFPREPQHRFGRTGVEVIRQQVQDAKRLVHVSAPRRGG